MWWGAHQGLGWWMLFSGLWMVLLWAVLIGLVVWGIRSVTGRRDDASNSMSPLEIARRRYAEGEISKEQFEEIRDILMGAVGTGR